MALSKRTSGQHFDIFDALTQDHHHHRQLIHQIEETSGDSDERKKLFEEFAKEALSHASAEEQSLYAVLMAKPDFTDQSRHSISEHQDIETLIEAMAQTDRSSGGWLIKFKSLKESYLHHIDEEEKELFPQSKKVLNQEDMMHMAQLFEKRKEKEKPSTNSLYKSTDKN